MTVIMSFRPEFDRISVRRAIWIRDSAALREVRTRVFIEEQSVPEDLEWDDDDAYAVHLLALEAASKPVGTARLLPTGQIGRMAVLPEWRNRGIGSALLHEILDIALAPGRPRPFLNAQVSAVPFYLRMGLVPAGARFKEAGISHQRMIPGT